MRQLIGHVDWLQAWKQVATNSAECNQEGDRHHKLVRRDLSHEPHELTLDATQGTKRTHIRGRRSAVEHCALAKVGAASEQSWVQRCSEARTTWHVVGTTLEGCWESVCVRWNNVSELLDRIETRLECDREALDQRWTSVETLWRGVGTRLDCAGPLTEQRRHTAVET